MKQVVALWCVVLCFAMGVSNAIAGPTKGKPTKLVEKKEVVAKPPAPVEEDCVFVRVTENITVTYTTPSLPAMYVAGPTCCCTSSSGVYISAVNGQFLGGTTTTIKTTLVCKGEVK